MLKLSRFPARLLKRGRVSVMEYKIELFEDNGAHIYLFRNFVKTALIAETLQLEIFEDQIGRPYKKSSSIKQLKTLITRSRGSL